MSLKELVKVADYYDVKYGFNKLAAKMKCPKTGHEMPENSSYCVEHDVAAVPLQESGTPKNQPDYLTTGVYNAPGKPARTFDSTTFQSNQPYAVEDKPVTLGTAWQYAKDMAPTLQRQLADVAKKVVEKLPAGVRPQLPSTSNQKLSALQKQLYDLKARANVSKDPQLAKDVNSFLYQVSQNKVPMNQIQSKIQDFNSKLAPKASVQPQSQPQPQPKSIDPNIWTTPKKHNPTEM